MRALLFLFFCFVLTAGYSHAQNRTPLSTDEDHPAPAPQLFNLNPLQENHHFHIKLPNDGLLDIDFQRLSDWGDQNRLLDIATMANTQVQQLKDSFRQGYTAKLIAINIPIREDIISVSYGEDASKKNQLAYRNGNYYELKTDFDTVRIIRNVGIRQKPGLDSGLVQIRYNFVLKDLDDLDKLVHNAALFDHIGRELDRAIADKRKAWRRPDASYYQLLLDYDPDKPEPMEVVSDRKIWSPFIQKKIGLYLSLGAVLFQSTVSPYFDYSLAYLLPSRGKSQRFVGLNFTSFARFNSDMSLRRNYTALNVEFGVFNAGRGGTGLLGQKTALAYGVMFDAQHSDKLMFNMSLSFGLTSYMSFGFGAASNFSKDPESSLLLMNLKFNL